MAFSGAALVLGKNVQAAGAESAIRLLFRGGPDNIPEVTSENFTGTSPRMIVLPPSFTTTGPLLAISDISEPVIDDMVPLTEMVFPAEPV